MVRRWIEVIRKRLTARRLLIGWCRAAGPGAWVPVVVCLGIGAVLPTLIALSTGSFVAKIVDATGEREPGPAYVALAVLVGVLLVDQAVTLLSVPLRRRLGQVVDGAARRRLRELLAAPVGIAHLEDQGVRNDAQRITRGIGALTMGQGADGQIGNWFSPRALPGAICGRW